jgi:hypothetical protein
MNRCFKPAPQTAWRRVDGEVVVLKLDTRAYYSINETGARIWELLAEGLPSGKVCEALAGEYGLAPEPARRDVEEFTRGLLRLGLIEAAL